MPRILTPSPSDPRDRDADAELSNALALPIALLIGVVLSWMSITRFLVGASLRMEVHELGHAITSWLGAHFAVPLPLFTPWSGGRSMVMFLIVAAALLVALYVAWAEGCRPLSVFLGALLCLQLVLSVVVSERTLEELMIFSGLGGELWLSTLFMIGFGYRLPARARWARTRWAFLLIGAAVFAASFGRWLEARHSYDAIPWGSAFGGPDAPEGDLNRLQAEWGWSTSRIVSTYVHLAVACACVIALHAAVNAWPSLARRLGRRAEAM